jgi:hypothetical protein
MKKLILTLLVAASAASAQSGSAPYVVRGSGQGFSKLQDALQAIGDGSGTIVIAPGIYRDCGVQEAGRVRFVAAEPGTVTLRGGICEQKAALVLRGRSATVQGIIFEDMRVPDRNGAGIRIEKGNLTVTESLFRNSENGILSANDPSSSIVIERSTFSRLGRCDQDVACAHSIYVGDYGSLTIRRSRFEKGSGGHYVKSRAPRIELVDSSFDDTSGRATNYMIDLSGGATGTIARNVFVQGKDKENYSALIMVAAEGVANSSDGLTVSDNEASIAPGVERRTSFLADASGDSIRIENNRLGAGIARYEKR